MKAVFRRASAYVQPAVKPPPTSVGSRPFTQHTSQSSGQRLLCKVIGKLLLVGAFVLFWAGMLRKLPDRIEEMTECEAACRHDPNKVFMTGYTIVNRRHLEDPNFVEVSGPFSERHQWTLCKWAQVKMMTPYYNAVDASDPKHESTQRLLDILDEVSAEAGAVVVGRNGVALGIYRDQRRTSCDADLDVWIIAKDGELLKVYDALRRIVPKYGKNFTFVDREGFSGWYYDPRMMIGRIEHPADGNKVDFELLSDSFTKDPDLDKTFVDRCGVSVRSLFSNMCWGRHENRTSSIASFSDLRSYLTVMYGPLFEQPILAHYDQKCSIQVHTPRALLRWWPFRLIRGWLELQPAVDLIDPLDTV